MKANKLGELLRGLDHIDKSDTTEYIKLLEEIALFFRVRYSHNSQYLSVIYEHRKSHFEEDLDHHTLTVIDHRGSVQHDINNLRKHDISHSELEIVLDEMKRNILLAARGELPQRNDELKKLHCEHGKRSNEYCEPCGRIHSY